jgi:hypothetical protein
MRHHCLPCYGVSSLPRSRLCVRLRAGLGNRRADDREPTPWLAHFTTNGAFWLKHLHPERKISSRCFTRARSARASRCDMSS